MAEDMFGDTLCARCGASFELEVVSADFDYHYKDSAAWKYTQIFSTPLCAECAEDDAETRWMDGQLQAADGPAPR